MNITLFFVFQPLCFIFLMLLFAEFQKYNEFYSLEPTFC